MVGSGPNGLAAAITLAQAGVGVTVLEAKDRPGGGMRTAELTLPGFHHDICSAIHPMAAAGSFYADAGVEVEWCHPSVLMAHPLDDGSAGVLHRSLDETVALNGSPRWKKYFTPLVDRWSELEAALMGPALRVPSHPLLIAQVAARGLPPATAVARWLRDPRAAALFVGIAAHTNTNLSWPLSSAGAVGLATAGHVAGWPCAAGGSVAIVDAMVARLVELGGTIECERPVRTAGDIGTADAVLFDLTPWQVQRIMGERIPARTRKAWRRFRAGNASFKLDYALAGPMPWTNADARRAGTVHLGGRWEEVAAAEATVRSGRVAERPYVLVAQQSLIDPTRAPAGQHTLWAYCHVPAGCTQDVAPLIEAQFDRFAPGWRDLVLARAATTPADLEAYNPNYIGGAIDGGASELHRVLLRPDFSVDPYRIGNTNLWLCSSSTPPGAGTHGRCGALAARSALRELRE